MQLVCRLDTRPVWAAEPLSVSQARAGRTHIASEFAFAQVNAKAPRSECPGNTGFADIKPQAGKDLDSALETKAHVLVRVCQFKSCHRYLGSG
jgi:hypothetical protein